MYEFHSLWPPMTTQFCFFSPLLDIVIAFQREICGLFEEVWHLKNSHLLICEDGEKTGK